MDTLRKSAAAIAGLLAILALFALSRPPALSRAEQQALASRFCFKRIEMPPPSQRPLKTVRQVHPSLQRLSAWISASGAAIALADLDGDGLNNDYIQVEPRADEVIVGPVPGTGTRFERFSLDFSGLAYDGRKMAPTGALAADLNEDGATDIVVYFWGRTPLAFLNGGASRAAGPARAAGSSRIAGHAGSLPTSRAAGTAGASARRVFGNGAFVARELVEPAEIWNTATALCSDLDGDGHLDLLFANYFQDGAPVLDPDARGTLRLQDTTSRSFNGGSKHILLWRGAGRPAALRYAHRTGVFPSDIDHGWTIAAGAADIDGDMLDEIYFANDVGPDRLMHNRSSRGALAFAVAEGRRDWFTPSSFVLGQDAYKGMGVDFGDLNGDLVPDIYVSNIACYFGLEESHFLWLSHASPSLLKDGLAPYVQASEKLGLSRSGWSWDCRLVDFDNDGTLEAFQTTGFIKGKTNRWPELQALGTTNSTMLSNPRNWPSIVPGDDVSGSEPNYLFARGRGGRYFDIAGDLGLDDRLVGRGVAVGDIDGDGDEDLIVANQWQPSFLFRNDCPNKGSFLGLKLLVRSLPGAKDGVTARSGCLPALEPSFPAIGARATITLPDGRRMSAQVDGGSGHSGKRAPELHFGLGSLPATSQLAVSLKWRTPAGAVREETLHLVPGWHTVELLWKEG